MISRSSSSGNMISSMISSMIYIIVIITICVIVIIRGRELRVYTDARTRCLGLVRAATVSLSAATGNIQLARC